MPDFISRKRLKKKVLDRWENEGGKLFADLTGNLDEHSSNRRKRKKKSHSRILRGCERTNAPVLPETGIEQNSGSVKISTLKKARNPAFD